MTTIVLVDAWFSLASDLTQSISMVLTGETDLTERPVEASRRAGGRVVARTRPGSKKELALSFELADRADLHQLEDWVGLTVLYRDPRGRRIWGVYGKVNAVEIPGVVDEVVNVNLTLTETTVDESA